MKLTEFLGYIDLYCDKEPETGLYYLWDGQGCYDLYNDDYENPAFAELMANNPEGEIGPVYASVPEIIDRVSGIWYDFIDEDLEEFGCDEDFLGDFEAMKQWMLEHKDQIDDDGAYNWYLQVIDCILDPDLVEDDAPLQEE